MSRVRPIATHEERGFFIAVKRSEDGENAVATASGKVSNVNKMFVLQSIQEAFNITDQDMSFHLLTRSMKDKDD